MTSILTTKILQALLMLATEDICPEADWYPEEAHMPGRYVVIQKCEIPLADDMLKSDAKTFYQAARRLAGRGDK